MVRHMEVVIMAWKPREKRVRPSKKRDRLHEEFGNACIYCLVSFENLLPRDRTVDHIVPRADGGTNDFTNLVSACRSCNSRRQDKPLKDFVGIETLIRLVRDYPRIAGTIISTLSVPDWRYVENARRSA